MPPRLCPPRSPRVRRPGAGAAWIFAPAFALILAFGPPAPLEAQDRQERVDEREAITVVGVITDASTGAPVPAARVRLLPPPPDEDDDADREPRRPPADTLQPREVASDAEGRFQLEAVRIAGYILVVESLGYRAVERPVRVMGASPFELRVQLAPEALALEGVVVTSVRSPRLAASGFYDRRRLGTGSFLSRDEIEDRFPSRTSDLLTRFAGVQLQSSGRGGTARITLRGGCRPDIVVDGLNLGPDLSVDDVLTPRDVEAVELYRGAGGPLQFSRSTCGAVLLWTADPATRAGAEPMSWRRMAAAVGLVALAVLLTR